LDPTRSFIHVFDDTTLDIIMSTLDTAADFLQYLRAKERFLRSREVYVAGEENLLGFYLANIDTEGQHDFVVDESSDPLGIDDSWWPTFLNSPERKAKIEHDRISYLWDGLIEKFAGHALEGTQHFVTGPAFESSERVLRFLAAEPRLQRRHLAEQLADALEKTGPDERRIRVAFAQDRAEVMYLFLLFPWRHDRPEEENREFRRSYLEACVLVAKLNNPVAEDIVGIATESGLKNGGRSEDAIYFDARTWSEHDAEQAARLQKDLAILTSAKTFHTHVDEYPTSGRKDLHLDLPKNPRNKPCPCGSGKKYKHCHARPRGAVSD
jgi:hypothetical protein